MCFAWGFSVFPAVFLRKPSYFSPSSGEIPAVFLHPFSWELPRKAPKAAVFSPLQSHPYAGFCALAPFSRRCWGLDQQQQGFRGPRCSTPPSLGFLGLPVLLQLLRAAAVAVQSEAAMLLRGSIPGPVPHFVPLSRPDPASAGRGPAPQPRGRSSCAV